MNTILLATDGSPSAKRAASEAIELAKATGWELRIVTAWRIPLATYGYSPLVYPTDIADIEREYAAGVLAEAVETASEAGVAATSELRHGEAAAEICAAAREVDAHLIILGAHGWGMLARLVFGSVSSAVLHAAHCPVMVIREPHGAETTVPEQTAAAVG
jgi:nucleotide-binding universal stress UspA family protein